MRAVPSLFSLAIGIFLFLIGTRGERSAGSASPLADRQLGRLRTLVQAGQHPRVLLSCAGQVAGQRGTVVAISQPDGEVAEFIAVRMDRDRDVLPFAPHELHLLACPDVIDDVLLPFAQGNLDRSRSSRAEPTSW